MMRNFLRDSILAFIWFTACLTPYMIWIVGLDRDEYLAWLVMQLVLVPLIGGGYAQIVKRLK